MNSAPPNSPRLSKSQYVNGLQCLKSLWLDHYRKDLIPETAPSLQHIFDQGHRIGELARKRFPGGRLIEEDYLHIPEALAATAASKDSAAILYEAAMIHDQVLIRPDILIRKGASWELVEVKGSTEIKDVYLEDVAIQKYVLEGAGFPIRQCSLMRVNNEYARQGALDVKEFFTVVDVSKEAEALQTEIPARLAAMRRTLELKDPPRINIGRRCSDPYDCQFMGHCWEPIPDYSVFNLVRMPYEKSAILMDRGILDIRDIPDDFPLTDAQELQVAVEKSGKPHIDRPALAKFLEEAAYPLFFLDFETISPVLPPYDGLRPFQQLPFQASIHAREKKGGELAHSEFLGDAKSDPRPALAEFLTSAIGPKGSVVAYNASFESQCLSDLAEACPDYRQLLLGIKDRLWDLATPFRKNYYVHPKFEGRWSIKKVLPALVFGMTYDGMDISKGNDASLAYLDLMEGVLSPTEIEKTISALKKYCGQDTLGMVRLLEVLEKERYNTGA